MYYPADSLKPYSSKMSGGSEEASVWKGQGSPQAMFEKMLTDPVILTEENMALSIAWHHGLHAEILALAGHPGSQVQQEHEKGP